MATLLLTFVILVLMVAAMAIGVIARGKPLKGSCGGIGSLGIDKSCEICGGDTSKCDESKEDKASPDSRTTAMAYDATKNS